MDTNRSTRLTLAIGVLAGGVYAVMTVLFSPEQIGLAAAVYHHAGMAILEGELMYDVTPPDRPGYYFLYPPLVGFLFVPHALVGSAVAAHLFQTTINLLAGVLTVLVIWRALERRGTELSLIDRGLIIGFVLLSIHGLNQLVMGQINHVLALAIALGLAGLEEQRERVAGVWFAVAALLKVFPTTLGLWLLRRRSWNGVAVAIGTGVSGLLLGVLVFGPELTLYYFTDVLFARFEGQTFTGTPDPGRNHTTVHRQLAALFGGESPLILPIAIFLFVSILGLIYRRIDSDERRLSAVLATLLMTLLILPLQPLYFALLFYPWIILLYRLPPGTARSSVLLGTVLTFMMFGQDTVADIASLLPGQIEMALLSITGTVFTFILPPTIGMWLLVAGCLLIHYGSESNETLRGEY